ncbi:MAG: ComF family protein [Bacteroidaceae bacterium]|nr:ComF family protein [Bacteroidaceae bacterium]
MKWISDLIDLIFPRYCSVCGELLSPQERDICVSCLFSMPRIEKIHLEEIEKTFWGKAKIERATSYMYYKKGSPYNNLIHNLKYKNHPEVGERLAYTAATELAGKGFFNSIDLIVPLPLSKAKRRKRGYNQCDYIAAGISRATGIAIARDIVSRIKSNETQTHKNREERWKNVEGIFEVRKPSKAEGRHILLVDDILTTGATLQCCAAALQEAAGCKISIFTLGYTYNGI